MSLSSPAWEYLSFAVFVGSCFIVPIYYKVYGTKERTKAEYVFATGGISMFTMMMSISRSTISVRMTLGNPSELFYRGAGMWETMYGIILACPIVCFVFVPIYYNLGITSVYQYLDMRFKSRLVRCLASFTYVLRILVTLATTVFTPCLALKAIIGLPYWASIISITGIGVVFNIMGGLKTAIHTDLQQALLNIVFSCVVIIFGAIKAGGFGQVVQVNRDHGRLQFFNFDLDPEVRVTTLSALFGQLFMSVSVFGCQQNLVQRYCSMNSQRAVTKTLLWAMLAVFLLFSMTWVVGMVMFANYVNCDPYSEGYIGNIDEILPYFIENEFHFLPGFLGLLMAILFNGALNVTMSNLSSTATVTWEDFLSHLPRLRNFSEEKQLYTIKILSVVYGVVVIAVAFFVGKIPGIIEASMLLTSATSGPLLGVFVLAMLFPCANWKGTALGIVASHLTTLWLILGSLYVGKPPIPNLPLSTEGCTNHTLIDNYMQPHFFYNVTDLQPELLPIERDQGDLFKHLYSVSYMYYSLIGCGVTVLIGIIVSYIAGTSPEEIYDEKLIHPLALKISNFFPGKPRIYSKKTEPEAT